MNFDRRFRLVRRSVLAVAFLLVLRFASHVHAAPGDLDESFGTGGKVLTDFREYQDGAFAVTLQADGKIVVAGYSWTPTSYPDFALARYNPDGTLDLTFGSAGKVLTDFGGQYYYDEAHAVAVQADGKIIAAGSSSAFGYDNNFALARYNPDGSLDASFGTDGKVVTDFSGTNDRADALAVQPAIHIGVGWDQPQGRGPGPADRMAGRVDLDLVEG